jgi:hypothetical protein
MPAALRASGNAAGTAGLDADSVDEPYRSYVVRVHQQPGGVAGVRLDIEDLQGGRRVAMRGAVARRLARILVRVIGRVEVPEP